MFSTIPNLAGSWFGSDQPCTLVRPMPSASFSVPSAAGPCPPLSAHLACLSCLPQRLQSSCVVYELRFPLLQSLAQTDVHSREATGQAFCTRMSADPLWMLVRLCVCACVCVCMFVLVFVCVYIRMYQYVVHDYHIIWWINACTSVCNTARKSACQYSIFSIWSACLNCCISVPMACLNHGPLATTNTIP